MTIVEGGIEAQTEQALKNMQAIVEDGGSSVGQVVKTTVRRRLSTSLVWHMHILTVLPFVAVFEVDGRLCDREWDLCEVLWCPCTREIDGGGRSSAQRRAL